MKWIVLPALLALSVAFSSPAAAQSMTGCWHHSDGNVFSTVCFSGTTTGGTFNLEYAVEDPNQGLVKGSCNGIVEVVTLQLPRIDFTVPFQEDACRQEDQVFRIAKRDYRCQVNGTNAMVCSQSVYYDNGQIFSQASGLEYKR